MPKRDELHQEQSMVKHNLLPVFSNGSCLEMAIKIKTLETALNRYLK